MYPGNSRTNKCAPLITLLNSYGNELRDVFNSNMNGSESCVGWVCVCVSEAVCRAGVCCLQLVTPRYNMLCVYVCVCPAASDATEKYALCAYTLPTISDF